MRAPGSLPKPPLRSTIGSPGCPCGTPYSEAPGETPVKLRLWGLYRPQDGLHSKRAVSSRPIAERGLMAARTYPVVRSVTMLIPELAQAWLRSLPLVDDAEYKSLTLFFLEGVLVGMGVNPQNARVNLDNMTVEVTL